ncbi:MAG TPA: alanine racemase [Acidimicrobiales bacterium]|nr:alanine racemase [Acidimicrobiales bacterium]
MRLAELATPALVIDVDVFERNLSAMAAVLPGRRLRPHVKAHKCTAIAAAQARHGHESFTCATPREMLGMAAAGFGGDLLLANEVLDGARLAAMAAAADANPDVRMTVAVDSDVTVDAAADAGLHDVLIDVNIGLPRCGCAPEAAGRLADHARRRGLTVRGVMGYEGHLMMEPDRETKREEVERAVDALLGAHAEVGGDIVSSGGTGTFDLHDRVTEVQAGSYALMDTQYATLDFGPLGHPFALALAVLGTVISVNPQWAVLDVGLKALGMDHGNPSIDTGTVWFCSDEHLTYAPVGASARPGERVRVWPAHIDPTMAQHERVHVVQGDDVIGTWPIDLRGW